MSKVLVVRTKLTVPRLHRYVLRRPRLVSRLSEALEYPLTIMQAGTGYGKSTALASLGALSYPLVWYHLDEEDVDSLVFLLHLWHGFHAVFPELSEALLILLEGFESALDSPWARFVDLLANELTDVLPGPTLLVLDDVHLLRKSPALLQSLDRFIQHAPPQLHIILATRYPLELPSLLKWQVKGKVLQIDQDELAFTSEEIATLFDAHYGIALSAEEIARLAAETEGWAIALQLVWQGLRSGALTDVPATLSALSGPTEQLFAYLAQEILAQQSTEVREFLHKTAVLRDLTPSVCNCLCDLRDGERLLRYLLDNSLFVVDLGGGHMRYHHLFREFLCRQLSPFELRQLHQRAARCCLHHDNQEEALYHLLAADAHEEAAAVLADLGGDLVRLGRLDTLAGWINALPPHILEAYPALLIYLGDIARLRSRFDEALGWYRQAEQRYRSLSDLVGIGRALRGQARIYLDTVNPSQAESILQEALRISDGQEDREARANLLELMAENRLNLGRPEEAEGMQAQAQELREEGPGEAELSVRVLLRTGQLDQARRILEKRAATERQSPVLRPRAHRETLLLFALILVFQGEAELAFTSAVEGTERGHVLNSPFITAVGYMRQGHAWLLRDPLTGYEEACRCYREAIRISDTLAVPRLKVEAYWGLCRAHGFRGAIDAAERAAEQGLALAVPAGDEWIAALIRLSLGAGYFLVGQDEAAAEWLMRARDGFHECGDTYGEASAWLWQSLLWLQLEDFTRLNWGLEQLLSLAREQRYDYLFTQQTFQGPVDPRQVVPLLLHAREAGISVAYVEQLLAALGLTALELHPGYQLRVQTLGPFRVWRGAEAIEAQEWRRENARLLFQLLLTHRHQLLDRDQIVEQLWPGSDPETALRDFKVALSTLFKVLEPERKAGALSAYVTRDGTLYGLRPHADLWLDAADFEQHLLAGDRLFAHDLESALAHYRQALALYQGNYLQEYPYAEWCSEERERLLALYLRAADRMAQALAQRGQWEAAIDVAEALLARDNCWEAAYRLLMTAHAHLGNRPQALRAYQRCVECLRAELDVAPSEETEQIHARVTREPGSAR